MNKKSVAILSAIVVATLIFTPVAEARRMGSGKSFGMSRSSSSTSTQNASSSSSSQGGQYNQAAPAQPNGMGWGHVAAGVATGAAAGYMLGHSNNNQAGQNANGQVQGADGNWGQQPVQSNSGISWFWWIVIGLGGYFLYRRFFSAKKPLQADNRSSMPVPPLNMSQGRGADAYTRADGQPIGNVDNLNAPLDFATSSLPSDISNAGFLRQARATFLHMQTMNNKSNTEELRRYFTESLFTSIQSDIMENQEVAEFPQLTAVIIESVKENNQDIISVLFSGMVSEELNSAAVPFKETWHFVRAITPAGQAEQPWLVAGIQQI